MDFVFLEFAQQVVDFLRFGHKIGWANEALPAESCRLREVGQQIFDVENAADVVGIVLIDGNAAIVILDNTLQHFGEIAVNI